MWASRREAWARSIGSFCGAAVMQPGELMGFHAKQTWIRRAIAGCQLPDDAIAAAGKPAGPPQVAMYGSTVVGTAFVGGDMDFAAVFPVEGAADGACPFVDVHRRHQAATLVGVNEGLVRSLGDTVCESTALPSTPSTAGGGDGTATAPLGKDAATKGRTVSLQRIFHARVPIVQCGLLHLPATDASGGDADRSVLLRWEPRLAKEAMPPVMAHFRRRGGASSELFAYHSEFDVSASLTGCRNSLLLREYCERYPWLRALCLVLKNIGRRGGSRAILNARGGWLSPYALTVMAVHFVAERGLVERVDPAAVEAKMGLLTQSPFDVLESTGELDALLLERAAWLLKAEASSTTVVDDFAAQHGLVSPLSLEPASAEALLERDQALGEDQCMAELLRGFFAFYADFDFDTQVIDIRPDGVRLKTRDEWEAAIRAEVAAAERECPGDIAAQENLLGAPASVQTGEMHKGRPLVDRTLWHRLGHDVVLIRDPIETHSLGRGVDFFRGEALREGFRRISKDDTVDPEVLLALPK